MKWILHKIWMIAFRLRITDVFSDRTFTQLLYFCYTGRKLDLANPVDFNQKEQWLKLYHRDPLYVICADKYAVRDYVKGKIGAQYLNGCIGVFEKVEDIDYKGLPRRFVLKATHGSGWNLICKDKATFDWEMACRKMRTWLRSDFSRVGREWQYHEIKPRIICEEFMEEPDGGELRDYKMFTFQGVTKYISVEGVDGGREFINFYDANWKYQPDKCSFPPNKIDAKVHAPECLGEMKELATKLAGRFPMCRVDFYVLGGKRVVFGELTFTPGKGCNAFSPQSFCDELGGYIQLPKEELFK